MVVVYNVTAEFNQIRDVNAIRPDPHAIPGCSGQAKSEHAPVQYLDQDHKIEGNRKVNAAQAISYVASDSALSR